MDLAAGLATFVVSTPVLESYCAGVAEENLHRRRRCQFPGEFKGKVCIRRGPVDAVTDAAGNRQHRIAFLLVGVATSERGIRKTPSLSAPRKSSNCFQCATSEIRPIGIGRLAAHEAFIFVHEFGSRVRPVLEPAGLDWRRPSSAGWLLPAGSNHFGLPSAKSCCC